MSNQIIKQITYPASKISGIIGKNPYQPICDLFDEYMCKLTGKQIKTLNSECSNITQQELQTLSKKLIPGRTLKNEDMNLEKIIEIACYKAIDTNTTQDSYEHEKKIQNIITNNLSSQHRALASEFITSNINKKRGIRNESKIINTYSKRNKTTVTDNNLTLYKLPLIEINKDDKLYKFVITAKIDGIENDTLIEIKNRRNRLFGKIPEYEQVQLEIYLRILKLNTAKLIENYNDTTNEHLYNCNDNLWNYIKTELESFSYKLIDNI